MQRLIKWVELESFEVRDEYALKPVKTIERDAGWHLQNQIDYIRAHE